MTIFDKINDRLLQLHSQREYLEKLAKDFQNQTENSVCHLDITPSLQLVNSKITELDWVLEKMCGNAD